MSNPASSPSSSTRSHLLFIRTPASPLSTDPYQIEATTTTTTTTGKELIAHHLSILQTEYLNLDRLNRKLLLTSLTDSKGKQNDPQQNDDGDDEGENESDNESEDYDGLILTSTRSVQAIEQALHHNDTHESTLSSDSILFRIPIFVVGQATSQALSKLVQRHSSPRPQDGSTRRLDLLGDQLGETGNGIKLAQFVMEHYSERPAQQDQRKVRLLYLVGDKNRETIPKMLLSNAHHSDDDNHDDPCRKVQFELDRLQVYRTDSLDSERLKTEIDQLEHELGRADKTMTPKRLWLIFFSPSGAKASIREFRQRGWLPCHPPVVGQVDFRPSPSPDSMSVRLTIRIGSIGPTTREYLEQEEGLKVDAEAVIPDAKDLLRVIMEKEVEERISQERIHKVDQVTEAIKGMKIGR